ncbi:MAG: hypothetical protein JWP02_2000, partial [Acidimicrobiales bacterium]|nr:hypothetical protein [Acidimicrobiales bacterium]
MSRVISPGLQRRSEVAIFTGPAWAPWSPHDIESKGLGGSETGVVRVAERLNRIGYAVSVYGDVEETVYRDIPFRRSEHFDPGVPRLATISSRRVSLFDRPIASGVRVLWATDIDYGDDLSASRAASIDLVVVPSQWHKRHMESRYPFLDGEAVVVVPNGIDPDSFPSAPLERGSRVLFSSAPDRGLDVLLELWPDVRDRVPGAELLFCAAPVYEARARADEALTALDRRIAALADQPGVVPLGSLGQVDLARTMAAARVWVAPSWCSTWAAPFLETFCIGAVEAQAAGCCVVASAVGALSETVRVGRLIGAEPNGRRWREELVDGLVEGLTDPAVQGRAELEGPRAVRDLGWDEAAFALARALEAHAGDAPTHAFQHPPDCPIFCINLARSVARRQRMERRLGHHGVLDLTTFVEAIPADSALVDERLIGLPAQAADPWRRAQAGALASHLKAIRTFVEETPESTPGAIICEDDVLLHNDWGRRLCEVLDNLPEGAPLCALYYTLNSWDGVKWAGRHPERGNLCALLPGNTWASVMYWISREYARTVLERWDTSFRHLPPELFPELILQWSGGYLCHPPLALEDAIDSELLPERGTDFHLPALRPWGYTNYSACEEGEELSPLARLDTEPRRVTIGLAVIARDEEDSLPALLATCDNAFDEVVLVDTGSKDRTVDRFVEWAETQSSTRCTVGHFAWCDDFSAARQHADDLLKTDWNVWADCDDEIIGAARLRQLAADAPDGVSGFRFGYDFAREEGGSSTAYLKRERLVRSGRGRWIGRVHEYQAIDGSLTD